MVPPSTPVVSRSWPNFDSSPQLNGPITIRDNLIRRVVVGVRVRPARDLTVRDNGVRNAYAGLVFQGITGSTARQNAIRSQEVGITLDSTSTGNGFHGNTLTGVGGACVDPTIGGGTGGTANTWTGNASTHGGSPAGICAPLHKRTGTSSADARRPARPTRGVDAVQSLSPAL